MLAAVAATLSDVARTEDVLARLGGDEFALLMPETDEEQALVAVERARGAIAAIELDGGLTVTVSAGICGLEHAVDPDSLVRLADGALYWGKAHGRDAAWVYDPEVVRELSISERADQLQRSQALVGIRALARAIDAKDQSTREHSQRVATLACDIARRLGWSEERVALLEDAALVHDVGKIGVPDAVLLKPGRLTDDEYDQIKRHAALGAQMVEDLLLRRAGRLDPRPSRAPRRARLPGRADRGADPRRRGHPRRGRRLRRHDRHADLLRRALARGRAGRVRAARRRSVRARARRRAGGDVPGRAAHNVCPVILKPCARSAGVTTPVAKRRP